MRHQKDFGCLFELVAGCEGCALTKDVTAISLCEVAMDCRNTGDYAGVQMQCNIRELPWRNHCD